MSTILGYSVLHRTFAALGLGPRWRHRSAGSPRGALEQLFVWRERAAQRRALQRLDDRALADIGLGRADVAREVSKPFWRP